MPSRGVLIALLAGTLGAFPGGDLDDPTRPATRSAVHAEIGDGATMPALRSIRLSPGDRVAVIDGRPVRVGDRVGEAVVVAIDLTGVRLRGARGEILLTLSQGGFKRPSSRNRSSK